MTDNFSLLDEPRRPWIDSELLKKKFLALSAEVHPDRVHQSAAVDRELASQQYAALNSAYNCLRSPKERIRHLLELEFGSKPVDIKPVQALETEALFEVGRLCQRADKFIAENQAITSPILKVQQFEKAQDLTSQLMEFQKKLGSQVQELLIELQAMNPSWESASINKTLPLVRLDEIYRLLGYFGRWSEQIQERIVQLSF